MATNKVLIVEDAKPAAIAARARVKAVGFEPTLVTTGEDAVDASKNNIFDFILMDIGLGDGIDGAQATHEIRQIEAAEGRARCPIIAVTSHVEPEKIDYYKKMGVDMIIEKPLSPQHLKEILEKFQLG